jgi:hypothetical protein
MPGTGAILLGPPLSAACHPSRQHRAHITLFIFGHFKTAVDIPESNTPANRTFH